MGSALWTGISGLNASSKELDVIANNLANTNTVGFKAGTTHFADVLSQSISGGASGTMQVGRGVSVTEIQTQFSTGSFESTGVATDVAIDGDGFFIVNDADDASYYTRAGAFRLNNEGLLVDTNGYMVQGKVIVNGTPSGALDDIALADVQSEPQVTSTFSIGANLNSDTATGGQYSTSQTVYDSLGSEHTLNTTFTKAGTSTSSSFWAVESSLDSTAATDIPKNGFIFDANGVCTGMYTGDCGTVTSEHNTATATPGGTNAGGGAIASTVLDRPGVITTDATITLTYDTATSTWSGVSSSTDYTVNIISADATKVNVDLNGDGTTDTGFTISNNTWADGDTVAITLDNVSTGSTATATPVRPGMIYQSGELRLTKSATAWTVEGNGGYTGARVTSSGLTSPITINLDGSNTTDITLTPTGTWNDGDTAVIPLIYTQSALSNIDVDYSGATLAGGATIGSGNFLTWNLAGDDHLDITQYASASVVRSLSADGYSSGSLKSLSIDSNGIISGFFTNGQTTELAQLMLAKFTSPWGLQKMGDNLFGETISSGEAVINYAGEGGIGSLTSNSLEMSNTDIATEFIKMITAQKAYQANAKVVTTENDMMQVLMNIKQ